MALSVQILLTIFIGLACLAVVASVLIATFIRLMYLSETLDLLKVYKPLMDNFIKLANKSLEDELDELED